MLSSSSSLVKLPLLPRGLLSYLPTSILPSGREGTATPTPTADAPSTPPPSSPKKMSSSTSAPQQQQAGKNGGSSSKAADSAELARVFELFDKNGDGRITREELEESLGKLGMSVPADELASMIARIDANGDGCVDVKEFGELYRGIMAGGDKSANGAGEEEAGGDEGEADEDMLEAFRVFDANGDGYITVDELGAVLSSLGLKQGRTAEECRRMIGHVDRDGDGRVDYTEFRQMMRAGGLASLG